MSEVIKVSYRSFGGFLLISFVFAFAGSSFAFLVAGITLIALSIFILLYPSLLEIIPVFFIDSRILDPFTGFVFALVVGVITIALGLGFYVLTIKLWNYSMRLDKGIAKYVDKNVPSTGTLIDRVKNPSNHTVKEDKVSKLERLTKLKDQGSLTQSEFEQEKQLILKGKD